MSLSQMTMISPRAKRIYLQRFLLAKFVYFKEELELRDLCCLFENQLWLEQKCQSDDKFLKKFGKSLEDLSIIMKEFNFQTGTTVRAIDQFSKRLHNNLETLILPKRNYQAAKRHCNGLFKLVDSKSLGKTKKSIPPPSRIGKGYRDKGTAKDVAFDGSPSWQEVATHRGPIYHKGVKINEISASSISEIVEDCITRSILRKRS